MNKQTPYIAVAPMMDWTDRHCRYFLRLIAPHVRLYTEMVTTGALIHGDRERFLRFHKAEHPLALQLGGNDPADLAACAKMAEDYGYDEVNLNCGCPSDRVQNGAFGACLMKDPARVAECVEAMINAVSIPVTVKCRIGVDECDELSFLNKFIEEVSEVKCKDFIIHARKAWLDGLSPKENREIPPLRYDIVEQIRQDFPHLNIILNGGIKTIEDIQHFLSPLSASLPSPRMRRDKGGSIDGVMIGREAYRNPYFLAEIERKIFNNQSVLPREMVARAMIPYIEEQQKLYDTPVKTIARHMIGLFHGQPGGKKWRQYISENAHKEHITPGNLIESALAFTTAKDSLPPVLASQGR